MKGRHRFPAALVLTLLVIAAGCGKKPQGPSVVFVSIDTLRADFLGSYGHEPKVSPNLDALAARGARFETCRAAAPWTLPSHASMFTGLYPTDHRAIDDKVKIRADATMLTERFHAAGYKTGAFVTHYYVGEPYGFDRGFDDFEHREEAPADLMVDLAIKWLKKNSGDPFFLFLHLFDPHTPYTPPPTLRVRHLPADLDFVRGDTADVLYVVHHEGEPKAEQVRRGLIHLYEGEIEFTDKQLGRLFEMIDKLGVENPLIVVTSDHGEEFMEHRLMEHGFTLYDEQLRVPLLMAGPGVASGTAVGAPVGLVDLMPTILDLAGLPPVEGIAGRSVASLARGDQADEALANRMFLAETTRQGPDRVALVKDGWKAIESPPFRLSGRLFGRELYDLAADAGEKTNISESERERAAMMRNEILGTGLYETRRLLSLTFAGADEPTKYLGTLRTNGALVAVFKDDVIYDVDANRQLVSREFGMQKDDRTISFLAFANDGANGLHVILEPPDAAMAMDLLVGDARDPRLVTLGAHGAHPEAVPFAVPADIGGARALPQKGYAVRCREVLANKHVVTRFEIGDQIEMSAEMVEKLNSLGYIAGSGAAGLPGSVSDDLVSLVGADKRVDYKCAPLGE
ncbi:sulfatase [bacterium]|nr:sulfatase [bacterium]